MTEKQRVAHGIKKVQMPVLYKQQLLIKLLAPKGKNTKTNSYLLKNSKD
jgi:hypothetical protein